MKVAVMEESARKGIAIAMRHVLANDQQIDADRETVILKSWYKQLHDMQEDHEKQLQLVKQQLKGEMLQLRKEMTEQMEESSKGLEKRQENKIATVEKELRAKLNEGEMQMKAVQTELKEEITECRNIADKNVLDLEHSKTLLQNMQAELKKEVTCVADACTEALSTTIRAEVCMPVLVCARFCVCLFAHVFLCVSPSLIHNPGRTHTHADTGDSSEFRE
jgi:hypothetical protein